MNMIKQVWSNFNAQQKLIVLIAMIIVAFIMTGVVYMISSVANMSSDDIKNELISRYDREKTTMLNDYQSQADKAEYERAKAEEGLSVIQTALNVQKELVAVSQASQKKIAIWFRDCKQANMLGDTNPPVDCSLIPSVNVVATGTTATGSTTQIEQSVPLNQADFGTGSDVISELDRSKSNLIEIAKRLNWKYNAAGQAQSPVGLDAISTSDRVEQLLNAYHFDERFSLTPGYGWELFQKVGSRYGLKPEFLVCVAKADSSLGNALLTDNNIGNVGNNDRGNKVHLSSIGAGIDHMGKAFTNKYLGYKQSIGSLTPVGGGDAPYYSTSKEGNWFNNVRNCLAEIHNDPSLNRDFMFRTK